MTEVLVEPVGGFGIGGGDDQLGQVGTAGNSGQVVIKGRSTAADKARHRLDSGLGQQFPFQSAGGGGSGFQPTAFGQLDRHRQLVAVGKGEKLSGHQGGQQEHDQNQNRRRPQYRSGPGGGDPPQSPGQLRHP